MPSNLTLKAVKGVIVMDSEGNVLVSKYYDQTVSEKNLFEKTRKSTGDIIMYENMIVIYRPVVDLVFYLLGGVDENEVMLQGALNAFIDALTILLKNQLELNTLSESIHLAFLCLDETIDQGIILQSDGSAIAQRVSKNDQVPIADQTISQVWKSAQEQLARSFLK